MMRAASAADRIRLMSQQTNVWLAGEDRGSSPTAASSRRRLSSAQLSGRLCQQRGTSLAQQPAVSAERHQLSSAAGCVSRAAPAQLSDRLCQQSGASSAQRPSAERHQLSSAAACVSTADPAQLSDRLCQRSGTSSAQRRTGRVGRAGTVVGGPPYPAARSDTADQHDRSYSAAAAGREARQPD